MRWNYLNFQIEKGDIKPDDYDYVVMSVDMLVEAALIRRQLKDRFPVKKKGTDRIIKHLISTESLDISYK